MIFEKYILNEERGAYLLRYAFEKKQAAMPNVMKRPTVVVCPGGGYVSCSPREADPVAFQFMAEGYHTFVLYYSLNEHAVFPNSLLDLCAAMKLIRENAEKFGVIEDQIAVLGFSAGCHLAGSYSVNWSDPLFSETLGVSKEDIKPNGMVLCYGVLFSEGEFSHQGSMTNLFKGTQTPELLKKMSVADNVTDETPPAFIWHTADDGGVPVENSLSVAAALRAARRPFELHVYPHGRHGMSIATWVIEHPDNRANGDRTVAKWVRDCTDWVLRTFGYDY